LAVRKASGLLAASPLGSEKRGVGSGGELVESIVLFEAGQAEADPDANLIADRPIDQIESALDSMNISTPESAHELVAAETNDRIEGA